MASQNIAVILLIIALCFVSFNDAFSPNTGLLTPKISTQRLFESGADDPTEKTTPGEPTTSESLESKMKSWEASEEEIKAATLGGVVPGRSDAFDVGLYIAFPLMVLSGLAFAFFPLIMGNIDTSSVGPPPTS